MRRAVSRDAAFDLFAVPFDGLVRIEASAGTGKTHTLADLYVRLVGEGGRAVDQILVVTYTVAASGELRERIHRRLAEARAHFDGGPTDDPVLTRLRERSQERSAVARRLAEAVHSFDEAAVFTIHGFCQRVLAECAFESGQPFASELVPDEHDLLQEVVDDFWRSTMPRFSPLFIEYLLGRNVTPDVLLEAVRPHLGKPYLAVALPSEPADKDTIETAYTAAYRTLRARWPAERGIVEAMLSDRTVLRAGSYGSEQVARRMRDMDVFLDPTEPHLAGWKGLEWFTPRKLTQATKKGQAPPTHPLFDACGALADLRGSLEEALDARRRRLVGDCLAFATAELSPRKRQRQLHAYEDLLTELRGALAGPQGERLAGLIRQRYPAALIDEFQDTDPVQYEIFTRVYGGSRLPSFLVGDPKQAIYGFRGADVFTYLEARRSQGADYTLDRNWRSDPGLIRAINTVWSRARQPFLLPEIAYRAVGPADTRREPLVVDGDGRAPLRLWVLPPTSDGRALDKRAATDVAVRATVGEIVRLLALGAEGRAWIGSKPLSGGDVAVLVRSNRQGRRLRDALLAVRVPCVQQVQDSVFGSAEAEELGRVLRAVAEPSREGLVRSALTTDLFGVTGDELEALASDDAAWERRLETFRADHECWREHGFIRMMRAMLRREGVSRRLLAFPDGERRLTNLLHLAELLHAEDERGTGGMTGVLSWLADRRRRGMAGAEEAQLRLESDENLVKIATVHKSKGLEYPIVFCPFLWDGRIAANDDEIHRYHDPVADHRPTLDLGSPRQAEARMHARREELAENLRLAYVALTRAQHRCYAIWGHVRDGATAPLAYLLHQPEDLGTDPMGNVEAHVGSLDAAAIMRDLRRVAQDSGESVAVEPLPEAAPCIVPAGGMAAESLSARVFQGNLGVPWRIASFSAIARESEGAWDALDDEWDAPVRDVAPLAGARAIRRFPPGARAGRCLHDLLARVDFAASTPIHEATVAQVLAAHAFDPNWVPTVSGMLQRAVDCPLERGADACRLREVARGDRMDELEFSYPVSRVTDVGMARLLLTHGYGAGTRIRDEVARLTFAPINGFMRGFVDLVFRRRGRFYLVDYKSNWLGDDPEAYREDGLSAVMAREAYYLQSLIYLVAVHRYLRHRLPGYAYARHVGGIFYLFLRGMDPQHGPEAGVYRDRPDEALVDALDRYLETGEES